MDDSSDESGSWDNDESGSRSDIVDDAGASDSAEERQGAHLVLEGDQPHTPSDLNGWNPPFQKTVLEYVTTIHSHSPECSVFVDHLRAIVRYDGKDHPRIDMVDVLYSFELPYETIYEVLKGPSIQSLRFTNLTCVLLWPNADLHTPRCHTPLVS